MDNQIDNSFNFFSIYRNKYLKNKIIFDLTLFNNHRKIKSFPKYTPFKNHRFYNYLINVDINFPIILKDFKDLYWPPFIEILKFGFRVISIDNQVLINIANQCHHLKSLFFEKIKHEFIEGTLANSIETLGLGKYSCDKIPVEALSSLKSLDALYLGSIFDKPINSLPASLRSLSFGYNVTQEYEPLDIYNFSSFNQPLDFVKSLPNLTYLDTGTKFNQPISPGSLNNGSLSQLVLGFSFNQPLEEGALPDTLTSLSVLYHKYGLENKNSVLPNQIKSLYIYSNLNNNTNLITPYITTLGMVEFIWEVEIPSNPSITTIICGSISSGFELKRLSNSIDTLRVLSLSNYEQIQNEINNNKEEYKQITLKYNYK